MPRLFAPHGRGLVSLSVWCGIFGASSARAETEAIRIEYSAVSGCPSPDEFRAKVFERATRARLASEADAARTFVVSIERRRDGVSGSLVVREASGDTVAREVSGAECSEVATALALATSLAIDPRASPAAEAEPSPPESKPETKPEVPAEPPPEAPAAEGHGWWSAALGPGLTTGISPNLAFGATGQLAWHDAEPLAWAAALGLELTWLEAPSYSVSTASSSFRFVLARPFLCSLELRPSAAFSAGPCLAAELGAVTGTGADLPMATTETRAWAAAELMLRFRLQPSAAWFAELDGALLFPFTRYGFVFREPDTQIYTVPTVAAAFGLRLGLKL
jgi:hypothetical protein